MAGSVGGILGMILAIPAYTVIRVILLEFFNKYRLVRSITMSMTEEQNEAKRRHHQGSSIDSQTRKDATNKPNDFPPSHA